MFVAGWLNYNSLGIVKMKADFSFENKDQKNACDLFFPDPTEDIKEMDIDSPGLLRKKKKS